jgi:hypothetical protein
MGINVHYIDNDWKPRAYLLDFVEIHGPHSGENLAVHLVAAIAKYNILDQVSEPAD